jgi:hypothetical protein
MVGSTRTLNCVGSTREPGWVPGLAERLGEVCATGLLKHLPNKVGRVSRPHSLDDAVGEGLKPGNRLKNSEIPAYSDVTAFRKR